MPDSVFRRIQKTGGSTYIVSLPKAWVEERLKKGDAVQMSPRGNDLVISTGNKRHREQATRLVYDGDSDQLVRQLIAHYLDGFDRFLIEAPKSSHSQIKEKAKQKVPGLETVEETEGTVLMQNLLSQTGLSFHATLGRLHFLVQSMLEKICAGLKTGRNESLDSMEAEVDRFFILAFRQLGYAQQCDPEVHEHAVYYVIVIKSLEKIADHAQAFSRHLPARMPAQARRAFEKHCQIALQSYNKSMQALAKRDSALAEEAVHSIRVERERFDASDFRSYNLLRVLDYSTDIAEMTLDMFSYEHPPI